MKVKIDNGNLEAKLELRRYFLRKLVESKTPINVMDCCAGNGAMWAKLRAEFPVASYLGCDKKNVRGKLKVDSARILRLPGWTQNVIDIDTYGSPFGHFQQLIHNCRHDVIIFLTKGASAMPRFCRADTELLGLGGLCLPRSLQVNLVAHILPHALAAARRRGFKIGEAWEAFPQSNARYLGLELIFNAKAQRSKGAK